MRGVSVLNEPCTYHVTLTPIITYGGFPYICSMKKKSDKRKASSNNSTARVYRRKGSRVKSALKFQTPRSKRTKVA